MHKVICTLVDTDLYAAIVLQIEWDDLQSKLRNREATIKSLTASKNTLERRFEKCKAERRELAQQNITLMAVKANLKGELSRYDEFKQDVHGWKEYATKLKESLSLKSSEVESYKKEKESMIKQVQDLQNEIEAWKLEVLYGWNWNITFSITVPLLYL